LSSEGILAVVNQTERSQLMNKIIAAEKLQRLLEKHCKGKTAKENGRAEGNCGKQTQIEEK
jgi:hypothetical protein